MLVNDTSFNEKIVKIGDRKMKVVENIISRKETSLVKKYIL